MQKTSIQLFELGFGTGLNAFLTLLAAKELKIKIKYTTVELYPIDNQLITSLNYAELLSEPEKKFQKLHQAAWGKAVEITDNFCLTKVQTDFLNYRFSEKFDLIYFDAFSPDTQPEMWTQTAFEKIYKALNWNGILLTYSSKGTVKQALRASGFIVKRLKGPAGKRHILLARKEKPTRSSKL